jgi:hypothetical protein
MREVVRSETRVNRFNEIDPDIRLRQVLSALEYENSQLKKLVVRLTEAIIRNIAAKR